MIGVAASRGTTQPALSTTQTWKDVRRVSDSGSETGADARGWVRSDQASLSGRSPLTSTDTLH